MTYTFNDIATVAKQLRLAVAESDQPSLVLRRPELKQLYNTIKSLEPEQRKQYGQQVNQLKQEIQQLVTQAESARTSEQVVPIDVTAPCDENQDVAQVRMLSADKGSMHPITTALNTMLGIFESMGFTAIESRQLDDDYHMFGSLNFPEGHPARDDFDTFITDEGLIAPAHTSTMQNRVLKQYRHLLDKGRNIQVVVPGRCFRNEDLDPRHEHTLHQVEGVMVGAGINTGNLIATLQAFLESYYGQQLEVKTQPAYFPFVEPGFEFSMSCPFCQKKGCSVCSYECWIEILGCGLIHPNVLKEADIDPSVYTGFAWGFGLDRLVMMHYNIDDIRWLHSGRIDFLEQFA